MATLSTFLSNSDIAHTYFPDYFLWNYCVFLKTFLNLKYSSSQGGIKVLCKDILTIVRQTLYLIYFLTFIPSKITPNNLSELLSEKVSILKKSALLGSFCFEISEAMEMLHKGANLNEFNVHDRLNCWKDLLYPSTPLTTTPFCY